MCEYVQIGAVLPLPGTGFPGGTSRVDSRVMEQEEIQQPVISSYRADWPDRAAALIATLSSRHWVVDVVIAATEPWATATGWTP